MIQIKIPAEMTALCKLSKKREVNDKLQYVYYDKPAGALVATNGHMMLIERLVEPLDAPGGYYEPTAGVYVEDRAGDDWITWDRVDPKTPGPAVPAGAFATAKAYTRKAAPVAVYIVITADGGAVAYKTHKDAKEAAWTLQGKIIETVLR